MDRMESQRRRVPLLVATAVAVFAAAVLVPAAVAGQAFHERLHDERSESGVEMCGGLTVDYTLSVDIAVQIVPRGPDGLERVLVRGRYAETFTANGKTATASANVMEKDLHLSLLADGSLSIVELATGNATLYGPDGRAIARDPGQLRYLLTVAPDGTITRGAVVKGSTGRSDDFCAALVGALS